MKIKNKIKLRNLDYSVGGNLLIHLIVDEDNMLSKEEFESLVFCKNQGFFITVGLSKKPKPKEMTLEQVCEELGREIKIVKE